MRHIFSSFVVLLACLCAWGEVQAQGKNAPSRGELLYTTHCIGCHSTQLHWRNRKLASNWSRLKLEVDRWQRTGGLGWRDEEVAEVARYLNTRYYHFPAPALSRSMTGQSTRLSKHQDQ
jgi:mono/diheme cytochrome c family protein